MVVGEVAIKASAGGGGGGFAWPGGGGGECIADGGGRWDLVLQVEPFDGGLEGGDVPLQLL